MVGASVTNGSAGQLSDQDRARLAHFSHASGAPDLVLYWLSGRRIPEPNLTLAHALIDTGRRSLAIAELEKLTDRPEDRGAAWLMLARELMADGSQADAAQALASAVRHGRGETLQEALFLQAENVRQQDRLDEAGRILSTMEPGYWSALGYQAIASSYSRVDRTPSRALVAIRVALAMAESDHRQSRSNELRSRLLLRAGYLAFQSGDDIKAAGFLEQVRLDSFQIPLALYYHGLTQARRQNFRAAMQSWHRARKYPLALPGVADAWLGMGSGYSDTGYLGQAGEAYLAANAAFEGERVTLHSLLEAVEREGAYRAMVLAPRERNEAWFLGNSHSFNQPRLAYLLRFADRPESQRAIQRMAELEQMEDWMTSRILDLEVFRDALGRQLLTLSQPLPANAQSAMLEQGLASLQSRLRGLEGLVDGQQRTQLQRLKLTLEDISDGVGRFSRQRPARRAALEELLASVESGLARLDGLKAKAASLQAEAGLALDRLAREFLTQEDRRIAAALEKTEQHLAHLYEHLALKNLEGDRP
ncbi:MAG: hypothetical protein R3175_02520 [Marinobacter sp.]|uniref:hypothetical protein n=1 Tax=Marinobacter sp. TaxID=50741 RepID=UPI00299E83FE|nr:hypothetical protein [Marinobacter sp.]MDX1754911.1 hypothetical protein [Marinobacter sp.]